MSFVVGEEALDGETNSEEQSIMEDDVFCGVECTACTVLSHGLRLARHKNVDFAPRRGRVCMYAQGRSPGSTPGAGLPDTAKLEQP